MWRGVERCWIEYSDTVPTRLDLDGKMALESLRRVVMVKYLLKGCVFESRAVDVASHPVVVEDGGSL